MKYLIALSLIILGVATVYAQTFNVVGCATISGSTITFISCPVCNGIINLSNGCSLSILLGLIP